MKISSLIMKFVTSTHSKKYFLLAFLSIIFVNINCSEKEAILSKTSGNDHPANQNEYYLNDSTTEYDNNQDQTRGKELLLFIGTYTWGSSKGIYVYKMDTSTGQLTSIGESPTTSNPSYLAVHPNKKWIYTVNENSSGTITALDFDTITHQLTIKNSVSSEGDAPCFISIDNTGNFVLVANYNSGNVAICPINSDGSLGNSTSTDQHMGSGPFAGRQDGPHAHMIMQAKNNFIYSTDLGTDKIVVYNLDNNSGILSSTGTNGEIASGSGPRHFAFHPFQPWAYVICELSGTIESFTVNNSSGTMTCFDTISTLPEGVTASAASADIHITPDGKFLYASNRGSNNNIAMYSIDQSNGKLTLLGHQSVGGTTPRNFAIDPSGKFLTVACQDNSKVIVFKIEQETGLLNVTGIQIFVPNPVCLKFLEIAVNNKMTDIKEYTR
jgi:6-phosphogluconolactonase